MNPAPRTILRSLGIGLVTGGVWLIVAGAVFRFFQGENAPFALGAYCAMLLAPIGLGLYLLIGPSRLNVRFKSIFFLTGWTIIASVLGPFTISAWQLVGLLSS
jgi:Mg/Co/Ni transporter MgtE